MNHISSLLVLAGVYLVVLASPGPNFFILTQMALAGRREEARYVVLGLTTGSVFWVLVSLAGLSALLSSHPWLATAVRALGAAYLMWYGARLLWGAVWPQKPKQSTASATPFASSTSSVSSVSSAPLNTSLLGAYKAGLLTGVTNPKGAAFWTSAFATLLPLNASVGFHLATVAMIATLSLLWHFGITVVFGTAPLRAAYLRTERAVNGLAGGVLVALGLQRLFVR